ncbi:MAG TPA: hypothetical protein VFF68_12745, partial [Anaerolineaceae bacterium]|nr:hypothetical protein [Anaerolineaceae bacterium]
MEESTETFTIEQGDWLFKVRPAAGNKEDQQVLVLVHGWTGDEYVMSIFARRIPKNYWLLYPRGPVMSPTGGYGWLDRQDPNLGYESYRGIAEQLWERILEWMQINAVSEKPIHLMGFSQGAAICYTLAVEHPDQTGRVAALA